MQHHDEIETCEDSYRGRGNAASVLTSLFGHCHLFYLFLIAIAFCLYRVESNGYNHGCNVLHELVEPWANTGRCVVGDSYFASVQAALRLFTIGLRFIGVIKTATTGYPMTYLGRVLLPEGKGDRHGVVTVDEATGCQLLAFVWCDRDRRYFISTCSSLANGTTIERTRWRQIDTSPNADPERKLIEVPQPKCCESYYSACSNIDRHNRSRQSNLMIEKKVRVTVFDKRINTSLFGMMAVDAWFLFSGIRRGDRIQYANERVFYECLIEQLIDNKLDAAQASTRGSKNKRRSDAEALLNEHQFPDSIPSHLQLISVTPTKRYKKGKTNHRLQGRCLVCNKPATTVCRLCQRDDPLGKTQFWICDKAGKRCMGKHIMACHPGMHSDPTEMKPNQLKSMF